MSERALPKHVQDAIARADAKSVKQAPKVVAKGTIPEDKRNGLEREYGEHLEMLLRAGKIRWYRLWPGTLRLADGARYEPDYGVMLADGTLEMHECKGFWREAARVRIKVAAELYPYRFVAITKRRERDGGGFVVEEF